VDAGREAAGPSAFTAPEPVIAATPPIARNFLLSMTSFPQETF
jgi:hypothetical protein